MTLVLSGTTGVSAVDGSAATPAIQGSDNNTGMFFPAADTIAFAEGGAEVARFNADAQFVAAAGTASLPVITTTGDVNTGIFFPAADTIAFAEGGTEVMRINSSGNLLVGTTTASGLLTVVGGTSAGSSVQAGFGGVNGTSFQIYHADAGGQSSAATVTSIAKVASTNRSINAAGTINASGADYAEYMTKAGDFVVAKGDVVGVNAQGLLTNVFLDAVSFVVKSTDPSYVGGDTWGFGFDNDPEGLEVARQKVDRIAFAGQVPVNVTGATPGQYIVPAEDNGGIQGVAKNEADMTLAEYMKAVGKVIAVEADGRAKIIVKVA